MVGIVAADLNDPFFAHQLQNLYDELHLLGYRVMLFTERGDTPSGHEALTRLLDATVDGVLLATGSLGSQIASLIDERSIPLVQLSRYIDDLDADRVLSDNRGGACAAARYVLGLGHRRFGVISGPSYTSTERDRLIGLTAAMNEYGLILEPVCLKRGELTHHAGYQLATEFLGMPDPPTVLFCANDVVAFGALDAARALNINVPDELSIVGFDNIPMAAWPSFQLTTVSQPAAEMAQTAVRMLAERIETAQDIGPGRTRTFNTNLVKRDTVAEPPAARIS